MSEHCDLTARAIRPEDFKKIDFRKNDLDSTISLNLGVVLGKMVRTCQRKDGWCFTWEDYAQAPNTLGIEKDYLDELVRMGYLSRKNGVYRVLDAFINTFHPVAAA
jgi:hypothetical protein